MQSKATTVDGYLRELAADRREVIEAVRATILKHLPAGFEEGMQYGMIGYFIPHTIYPAGYHCDPSQPLPYASLASQKNYLSLYLMCIYGDPSHREWFQQAWTKAGKKLSMGKSCVRFKKIDDVPLEVVGEAIGRVSVAQYIEHYERTINRPRNRATKKKPT